MALVPGGGPTACRSLHDGLAVGRAQAPPTASAALSQVNFEQRELLGHRIICLCFAAQVQLLLKNRFETATNWE
jgi:hypothetical protein